MNTLDIAQTEIVATSEFAERLSAAAEPAVGEFFSEDSKPVRVALIAVSVFAIFARYGAIAVTKLEASAAGSKIEFSAGKQFNYAVAAVLLFLLALYIIRYFIDRYAWVAKKETGDLQVMALDLQLKAWEDKHQRQALVSEDSAALRNLRAAHLATRNDLYLARVTYAARLKWLRKCVEIPFPVVFGLAAVLVVLQ